MSPGEILVLYEVLSVYIPTQNFGTSYRESIVFTAPVISASSSALVIGSMVTCLIGHRDMG